MHLRFEYKSKFFILLLASYDWPLWQVLNLALPKSINRAHADPSNTEIKLVPSVGVEPTTFR